MQKQDGCRSRRQRLLEELRPTGSLLLGDPIHLRYLAGVSVDPFSLSADFGALLRIQPDGFTTLFHDHRLPKSIELAQVDEKVPVPWYDGLSPGQGPRRMILAPVAEQAGTGGRIHDSIVDPMAPRIWQVLCEQRRRKDPDEIAILKQCMRATEAGHFWARDSIRPGMTELDVYLGVTAACCRAVGFPVVVYGDFAVSPGMARRGGPPTGRVLVSGDTFILDFSVVIQGYRSDFTNTLVVGREPSPEQVRLFERCQIALSSGEANLMAGVSCQQVYDAVRSVFETAGLAGQFPHHAGHGLGLGHPEAPFLVKSSTETLVEGDVVTLEPGLYVDGVGGIRIEHNYLITSEGFERLSQHTISLT